tara:strand:- start:4741 stop:5541 length:801 start_codon:yes stop_codon:yes gene_type:complete
MSSSTGETDTMTQIKQSGFFVQWLIVACVMVAINIILTITFGKISPSFFCSNLENNSILSSNMVLAIFTILSFVIIFTVRQTYKDKEIPGATTEEQTETTQDVIPYLILTVAAYTYASSFIRRKYQMPSSSAPMGGGAFSATVQKIESIDYGTLTLFIGIIVFIVNIMSYIFIYLRNKSENRKNKYARSIYFAQIATLIIGILTSFFVAGFGCQTLKDGSGFDILKAVIKWAMLITLSILGVNMINKATDGEDWFGGTKEENEKDD